MGIRAEEEFYSVFALFFWWCFFGLPFSVALLVLRKLFTTDVVEPSIFEWGLVPGRSIIVSLP